MGVSYVSLAVKHHPCLAGRKLGDWGFHCTAEREIRRNLALTAVCSHPLGAALVTRSLSSFLTAGRSDRPSTLGPSLLLKNSAKAVAAVITGPISYIFDDGLFFIFPIHD